MWDVETKKLSTLKLDSDSPTFKITKTNILVSQPNHSLGYKENQFKYLSLGSTESEKNI